MLITLVGDISLVRRVPREFSFENFWIPDRRFETAAADPRKPVNEPFGFLENRGVL